MKRQTDHLWQGGEEVNKRIKQKIYIFKQTKYHLIPRKTAEGNDCGRITATNIMYQQ